MAQVTIKEVRLHRLCVPLKNPFSTHLQTVEKRESIIIEMIDSDGVIGLGECVAFSSPWYTEETVQTCWDTLVNWLIPALINQDIQQPSDVVELYSHVKGNRMAKASLDQAMWDLFAKKKGQPLWALLGGVKREIDAGIVLTGPIDKQMYEAVHSAAKAGYKRVKIKIDEHTDSVRLKQLIASFEQMLFFADANGIFDKLGLNALLTFDEVGLALIEQPFGEDAWHSHVEATRLMSTPIALDESIRSLRDVRQMAETKAGSIIVLKPGRVGGITETLSIINIAKKHHLQMWIGGMIEFGISKAHNLALASLPQFSLPGDFSASTHFWDEDPAEPGVAIVAGSIKLGNSHGIGVHLNKDTVRKYSVDYCEIKMDYLQ